MESKATNNSAKDVETKGKRKDIAAKLGEAVFRRAKQEKALNETSVLCNRLATQIEELEK